MIYAFIADRCTDLPVGQCCRVMKMSLSAFFAWKQQRSNPSAKESDDMDFVELIAKIHDQSFGTYGRLRVTAELQMGLGRRVNHRSVG